MFIQLYCSKYQRHSAATEFQLILKLPWLCKLINAQSIYLASSALKQQRRRVISSSNITFGTGPPIKEILVNLFK